MAVDPQRFARRSPEGVCVCRTRVISAYTYRVTYLCTKVAGSLVAERICAELMPTENFDGKLSLEST